MNDTENKSVYNYYVEFQSRVHIVKKNNVLSCYIYGIGEPWKNDLK